MIQVSRLRLKLIGNQNIDIISGIFDEDANGSKITGNNCESTKAGLITNNTKNHNSFFLDVRLVSSKIGIPGEVKKKLLLIRQKLLQKLTSLHAVTSKSKTKVKMT